MSLLINLTSAEEAQLSDAASQTGMAPEAYVAKLVRAQLPRANTVDDLDARLRERQQGDKVKLMPTRTAAELFAEWDRQGALMTEDERKAEEQLWEDFQMGINKTRAELGMRLL